MTPAAAARLDRAVDALMPRIRITELLWEVNGRTGLLDAFNDVRSGRTHSNPAAILATILAAKRMPTSGCSMGSSPCCSEFAQRAVPAATAEA